MFNISLFIGIRLLEGDLDVGRDGRRVRVGVEVDALAAVRVEGAHLGVVARIFGEYVQVLDIDADAQALDDAQLAEQLRLEVVRERDVADAQEVAVVEHPRVLLVLAEVHVRREAQCGDHRVLVLRRPGVEHRLHGVAVELAVLHHRRGDAHDLEAVGGVQVHHEREALVAEGVHQRDVALGGSVAHDPAVVVVDHVVVVAVLELQVAGFLAVFAGFVHLVEAPGSQTVQHEERAPRLAGLGDGVVAQVDALAADVDHHEPVGREDEVGRPLEILVADIARRDRELETLVADLAQVGPRRGVSRRVGNLFLEKQVGGGLVVVVHDQLQPVVEQRDVETDVELLRGLPLQVGVAEVREHDVGVQRAVEDHLVVAVLRDRAVVGDRGVAHRTVAGAQLQVAHPFAGRVEEGLLGDDPRRRGRGEPAVLVVGAEVRGAVGAQREAQQVLVAEGVVHAEVVGVHRLLAHARRGLVIDRAGAEVVVAEEVVEELLRTRRRVLRVVVVPAGAQHEVRLELVVEPRVGIGEVVLVRPAARLGVADVGIAAVGVGLAVQAGLGVAQRPAVGHLIVALGREGQLLGQVDVGDDVEDRVVGLGDALLLLEQAQRVFGQLAQRVVVLAAPRAVLVAHRNDGRHLEHVAHRTLSESALAVGGVGLVRAGRHDGLHVEPVGDVALHVHRSRHALRVGVFDQTFEVLIGDARIDRRLVVARSERNGVVVGDGRLRQRLLPVGVVFGRGDQVAVLVALEVAGGVLGVVEEVLVGGLEVGHHLAAVSVGAALHLHVFVGVEQVELAVEEAEAHLAVVGHGSLSLLARLGGDDDHAVGALRTVHGGCGGVLQHVDRLHVFGIDERGIDAHHAVHDVDRVAAGVDRTHTADTQRRGAARTSGERDVLHAGDLARDALHDVEGRGAFGEVFVLHGSHRRGEVAFGQRTVADHHHFVDAERAGGHRDVDLRPRADGDLLGLHADERELEHLRSGRNAECVGAVARGHFACGRAFRHDGHAGDGGAALVRDDAFDDGVLRLQRGRRCQDGQHRDKQIPYGSAHDPHAL